MRFVTQFLRHLFAPRPGMAGCNTLLPSERMKLYEQRRGEDEAQLERMARGIKVKRRMLAEFRNIDARKAQASGVPVILRRPRLSLAR